MAPSENEFDTADLEGVMLIEISQRKTNTIRFHLYVEFEK